MLGAEGVRREVVMDATTGTMGIADGPMSRDRMRAADTDRERIAEQLRSAHTEGRLDLTEYDERLQQAWAARPTASLRRLPPTYLGLVHRSTRTTARCAHPTGSTGTGAAGGPRSPLGPAQAW